MQPVRLVSYGFFILARFVLVKYSRVFVERPSQGTSSLASRLTTVSLDSESGLFVAIPFIYTKM